MRKWLSIVLSTFLVSMLVFTNVALAAGNVSYVDENGKPAVCSTYTDFASLPDGADLKAGWYVISGSFTRNKRYNVKGDVSIILTDGAEAKIRSGIHVGENEGTLSFFGQKDHSGKINVPDNSTYPDVRNHAAIGGNENEKNGRIAIYGSTMIIYGFPYGPAIGGDRNAGCGEIEIFNGTMTAKGGDFAAVIGCGDGGSGGSVIIHNGQIKINGSAYGEGGAGIGGGKDGNSGDVRITGGKVTAEDLVKYGSGIGGGNSAQGADVTISGKAHVTATGGDQQKLSTYGGGAGIGGGDDAGGGTCIIKSGTVIANGGSDSAGIGGGDGAAQGDQITIKGGDVTANGGTLGAWFWCGNDAQYLHSGGRFWHQLYQKKEKALLTAAIIYHAVFNILMQSQYRMFSFVMTLALCYPLNRIRKNRMADASAES